jgi:hypothetical protein
MTESTPESTMVSARARARRSGLGRGLLVIAAVLALTGVVSAFIAPWSELLAARQAIATRMTDDSTPHRFVAPGSANFDLPAGRIFVAYLTDAEFDGTRYLASGEMVFDLTVTGADGTVVEIEHEPTQRANLPSSRPGRASAAVLVAAATIPATGSYAVSMTLGDGEVGQAVGEILVLDQTEVAALEKAFMPVLGALCGLGGAIFFGVFGGIAVWLERRAGIG